MKRLAAALVSIIVAFLGGLWLLQGVGVLRLCPVLCFADCECVTGGSSFWTAAGAIAFMIGITILGMSLRKAKQRS